jgi:hypothetical protein
MIWKMSIIQVYSKGTCSGLGWGEDIKIWCDGRKVEWVQSREVQYFSFFIASDDTLSFGDVTLR